MVNSLTVFLAFFGFLVFGYLSFLRLLAKHHLNEKHRFFSALAQGATNRHLLINLGSSAFFIGLPATALLLFWGWVPALIWLAIFHFFIESLFHLQFSAQKSDLTIADHLLRSHTGPKAILEQGLIQAFFLLSMAVVVALVATLLDRQPGLLFALLFLLPARQLISHTSPALPKFLRYLGALGLIALGLAFSDQLGFSVYGDWAPLGATLPWLTFNMPTLIAAIIVVAVFKLETDPGFKNDLSLFAGVIILLLILLMIGKLAFLRPILDAPMNAGSNASEALPNFAFVSLFIFAGFAALLIRLLNEEDNGSEHADIEFGRLQVGSALQYLYMGLLALSLAAALGIGAWKTHYLEWSTSLNILDYLNLAISSNLNLIYAEADSGTPLHTVLLAALCFTGFSFLLMCANQLTLEEADKETVFSLVVEAKLPQAIGIFIASAYFIGNGITIDAWFLIGMLAWVLFCHLAIGLSLAQENGAIFAIATMVIVAIGAFQTIVLAISWVIESRYWLTSASIIILLLAAYLWLGDLLKLPKKLTKQEKASFL